jgi:4-carboxymuconolactone decarboxylase
VDGDTPAGLHHDLQTAVFQLFVFDQLGEEADLMDILGAGLVDAGVLLDGQDELAPAPEGLVEGGLGLLAPDEKRKDRRRERNEVPDRNSRITLASFLLVASLSLHAEQKPMPTLDDVRSVAPALENYTRGRLLDEVWKRPGLSLRDRSIVTLAALIARNQTIEMPYYVGHALDNGVKPGEISELITHLAFYSGWPNAMAALGATKQVFAQRKIGGDQLPAVSPPPLPLNEAAEAQRAERIGQQFGTVAPGVVQYTTDILFRDLWLRPGLAPRDRSLVTVSALIASGQVAQMPYHLNRAMDNGLTQAQAAEVLTQLAFYAGWPNVFSALPVAKEVFEKRPR